MLIAIMANSFQKVLDNKQVSAMKEKIKIISDYRFLLSVLSQQVECQYIFEIKPKLETQDEGIV